MNIRVRHAALAALAAGGFLACDHHDNTVRIGAVVPLSGEASSFGQSLRQGYELAAEEWNAQGGILGRKVRLLFADDLGDPVEGAAVCSRLVEQDKVVALLGPALSKVAMTGAVVAQAGKVPMVTPTASCPKVTEVGSYIFRACFTDPLQAALGANFAYDDLGARKAACLFEAGNEYGQGLATFFQASFASRGGQIVGNEAYSPSVSDFKAQLARILPAGPDLLYLPGYVTEVAEIAKEARRMGYRGPFMGGDGCDSSRLVRLGGEALGSVFYTTHCSKDNPCPRVQTYVKKHKARFRTAPDGFAIQAYDSCHLLLDAISRAGQTDPLAIRSALNQANFHAVTGQIRFDPQRNPPKPVAIVEIRNGQPILRRTVEPSRPGRMAAARP